MIILGIETSCDETAAAIVENGREVLGSFVLSQAEEHKLYGGVVPEIASRRHAEGIAYTVDTAIQNAGIDISQIDGIAVTYAPGLIGALLVGLSYAKSFGYAISKPIIPVHHLRGHIAANYITHKELKPPFLCLVTSGGNTQIVAVKDYTDFEIIGATCDDAAGEAFDKAARALGFPYPGGVHIDKEGQKGNPNLLKLPHPNTKEEFDFSFSGLKTAVINMINTANMKGEELNKQDIAAAFQETVGDILSQKFFAAAKKLGYKTLVAAGGVSANSCLRKKLIQGAESLGADIYLPELRLCGDNAEMIAAQGYYEYLAGNVAKSDLNAYATMPIDDIEF